jgi:hypothetical protein
MGEDESGNEIVGNDAPFSRVHRQQMVSAEWLGQFHCCCVSVLVLALAEKSQEARIPQLGRHSESEALVGWAATGGAEE